MSDIFDLAKSKKESEFIKFCSRIEFDVTTNMFEVISGFPYVGALVKMGLVAYDYFSLRFFRKIAYFLSPSQDIPKIKIESFITSLNKKERKKIADYITHYLLTAEDDEKAIILGYLYCECVKDDLDKSTFLRLCYVVNGIFLQDLKALPKYLSETVDVDVEVNSFINLGLIDNELGGIWKNTPSCELNELGKTLCGILKKISMVMKHRSIHIVF